MIAQARITSDTEATVYLADDIVELTGANLAEVRAQVKQIFIAAARKRGETMDVVIVEPDIRHHLAVETSGRIASRPVDERPLFGPPADPNIASSSSALSAARVDDDEDGRWAPRMEESHSPAAADETAADSTEAEVGPGSDSTDAEPSAATSPSPAVDSEPTSATEATTTAGTAPAPAADASTSADRAATDPSAPGSSSTAGATASRPTLHDLQSSAAPRKAAPATKGLPGLVHRLTGGLISPRPNRVEQHERDRAARLRRPLDGPKNIAVVNLKGGAHKTTASLMIAATLGVARGGSVLAWDNNETRGTLGWRGIAGDHHRTALDLLHDIETLRGQSSSVADLDRYVRPQGETQFDILASDEDPGSAASMDGTAFDTLNETLSRFYRLKVIDTGNNVRASNWLAAVRSADQLVIISTVREDTFNAAAWMIDELRATGLAEKVDDAVTVLSHSARDRFDPVLRERLTKHFGAHTRAVAEVPYEESFVDGSPLNWPRVSPATKEAWLEATATIVDGL